MRAVVKKDFTGEWRWSLIAKNNQIVAVSGEGYENKGDCLHGLELTTGMSNVDELSLAATVEDRDSIDLRIVGE